MFPGGVISIIITLITAGMDMDTGGKRNQRNPEWRFDRNEDYGF
jgi:hypothetical protein